MPAVFIIKSEAAARRPSFMADPVTLVGIASSVVKLIDSITKVCHYIGDIKNAPEERRSLFNEAESLRTLIENLKTRAKEEQTSQNINQDGKIQPLHGLLEECNLKLGKLTGKLEPRNQGSVVHKFWMRATWPLYKAEIMDVVEAIERFKTMLSLLLLDDMWIRIRKWELDRDSRDRRKIISWLSPLNFFATQKDVLDRWLPGTGGWILESYEFKLWVSGTLKTLWCRGMPGAGKTILASVVVDHLRREYGNNVGVAAIYCNYKDVVHQTPENLLASLWMQLVHGRSISDYVKELHENHINQGTRPTLGEVSNALRSAIDECSESKVYIIIDALDECPTDSNVRQTLIRELGALRSRIHLMVTSRPHVDVERAFPGSAREKDIREYVDQRIYNGSLAVRLKEFESLVDELRNIVVRNTEGMFLLAQLHMEALETKTTISDVRNAMTTLPKGLDATYEEAMRRICNQNDDHKALALRVLSWVSSAIRPLSVQELQEALAVQPGDAQLNRDNLPDQDILISVCAGLIIHDAESNAMRLAHYTAYDYLERLHKTWIPDAQKMVATTCLTYLSFDGSESQFPQSPLVEILDSLFYNFFFTYAVQYWGVHAREVEEDMDELIVEFLKQEPKRTRAINALWYSSQDARSCFRESTAGIILVAFFGLETAGQKLLTRMIDVTAHDLSDAASIALYKGHEQVFRVLVEKCVEIDAQVDDALEAQRAIVTSQESYL